MIFRSVKHKFVFEYMAARIDKKTKTILIAAGIVVTAVIIYRMARRKKEKKRKLNIVSDEGYETAEDILFPRRRYTRFG
jgi:hypothetical protein